MNVYYLNDLIIIERKKPVDSIEFRTKESRPNI